MGISGLGGVSLPLGSAGCQPAVFMSSRRCAKTQPSVLRCWSRWFSNDDLCQRLTATNQVRLAGKCQAVFDVGKAGVSELAEHGRQSEIVESSLASFAFQPGAIVPHAEGSFGIANRSARVESAPNGK